MMDRLHFLKAQGKKGDSGPEKSLGDTMENVSERKH
jgi:hypothetical protein